jgi:hypothetical protein
VKQVTSVKQVSLTQLVEGPKREKHWGLPSSKKFCQQIELHTWTLHTGLAHQQQEVGAPQKPGRNKSALTVTPKATGTGVSGTSESRCMKWARKPEVQWGDSESWSCFRVPAPLTTQPSTCPSRNLDVDSSSEWAPGATEHTLIPRFLPILCLECQAGSGRIFFGGINEPKSKEPQLTTGVFQHKLFHLTAPRKARASYMLTCAHGLLNKALTLFVCCF